MSDHTQTRVIKRCTRCGLLLTGWRVQHLCPHGKRCAARRYRPSWWPLCVVCLFEYALGHADVRGDG